MLTFACIEAPELAERKSPSRIVCSDVADRDWFARSIISLRLRRRRQLSRALRREPSQLSRSRNTSDQNSFRIGSKLHGAALRFSFRCLSEAQLTLLNDEPYTETVFQVTCQRCNQENAFSFVAVPETGLTMALCPKCHAEMTDAARREILERLERQPPHPGEKAIFLSVSRALKLRRLEPATPFPRSGTSILTWCLGQHSNIFVQEESNWIGPFALQVDVSYRIGTPRRERSQLSALGVRREDFFAGFGESINALILNHRKQLDLNIDERRKSRATQPAQQLKAPAGFPNRNPIRKHVGWMELQSIPSTFAACGGYFRTLVLSM